MTRNFLWLFAKHPIAFSIGCSFWLAGSGSFAVAAAKVGPSWLLTVFIFMNVAGYTLLLTLLQDAARAMRGWMVRYRIETGKTVEDEGLRTHVPFI